MQIWGHRGAYSERPENTLHAFARAVELGANGVELDIQLSKDGEIVVIHDERIDRISNGTGMVKDYTLQELKKFNFNKRQIAEPKFMEIPTLSEVLELLKPHKNISINIELKTGIEDYPQIEEKTLTLVKKHEMLERILFSSFNHFTMQTLKRLEPNAETALLCGGAIVCTAKECLALGAKALNIDAGTMKRNGIVKDAIAQGVEVNVWNISSTEDLLYAKNAGVNAVIVNNIVNAKNILENQIHHGILCWYPFEKKSSVLDLSNGFLTDLLKEKCGKILNENSTEKPDYTVIFEPKDFSCLQKSTGKLLLIFESSTGNEHIKEALSKAGFKKQKWYYPFGNHRTTLEIFSDNFMPNYFFGNKPFYGLSQNEISQLKDRRHGCYMVEALTSGETCDTDYAKITLYRKSDKRFATVVNYNTVRKIALHPSAKPRLKDVCENHNILNKLGIVTIPVNLDADGNSASMPRYSEPVLWDYWLEKIKAGKLDENEMLSQFDYIRDSIFKVYEKTKKCFWELVPANAFYNEANKQITFFDQEFSTENLEPNIAVVRAIQAIKYQPLLDEWNCASGMYEKLQERYNVKENFGDLLKIAHGRTDYVFG